MNDLGKILFERLEEIRVKNNGKIEIDDIDTLIASFMDSMKGYISSQSDIIIFNQIEKIATQIKQAKHEVEELNPKSIGDTFIPGATSELRAVTKATEQSTNVILDAAEVIQNTAMKLEDKDASKIIVDKITEIFEACNFQDITGQRINKSLKLIDEIHATVNSLIESFTKKSGKLDPDKARRSRIDPNQELLSGPQINAPTQDQIDNLFKN